MYSWQRSFSFPVVTPGRTCGAMKSSTSEASRPAMRIRCSSSGPFKTTAIRLIMLEFRAQIFPRLRPGCSCQEVAEPEVRGRPNPQGEESVGNDASDAGSRGPFRTSDPVLEPEDGAVHLRPPQQDPYHQSREDARALPGRAQVRAPARREPRLDPFRRHEAP